MTWNADEQRAVANALLGSWPETISRWGQEAFAAFIGELQARGLAAADVIRGIRTWSEPGDFPPSAPSLAAAAASDPDRPTWPEAFAQIFGKHDRHPLVEAFVASYGWDRLRYLPIYDDEHGPIRQRELADQFEQFAERHAERSRAELVALTTRRGLKRADFLQATELPASDPAPPED